MIMKMKCVRCLCELDMFGFYKDAAAFEEELLEEGLEVDNGDVLCDDCAEELA